MQLLTAELRKCLPPFYSQEKDPVVHAKFFTPDSNWAWYVMEGSRQEGDYIFCGYVFGLDEEWSTSPWLCSWPRADRSAWPWSVTCTSSPRRSRRCANSTASNSEGRQPPTLLFSGSG